MIALWLWFLAAFGFAFVAGHSKISLTIRELLAGVPAQRDRYPDGTENLLTPGQPAIPPMFGKFIGPWLAALLECVGCLGWWLGFVAGASGFVAVPGDHVAWAAGLFLAFATSGANLLLAKFVGIA